MFLAASSCDVIRLNPTHEHSVCNYCHYTQHGQSSGRNLVLPAFVTRNELLVQRHLYTTGGSDVEAFSWQV
jgi:hypothetical protein